MPNLKKKQVVSRCSGFLLAASLGLLSSAGAQATPPPETVAESFGVPTAIAPKPDAATLEAAVEPPAVEAGAELTTAEKIKALLAESPDDVNYGSIERCISRSKVKRYEVLDNKLLLIHGRKGKLWINQFPRKCVGLRRNMALIMEVRGAQICANDSFYARREFERLDNIGRRGASLGSVHCAFAPFESVSEEQAEMIKQAVKKGAFR